MVNRFNCAGLIEELLPLVESGELHLFDAEWICRLTPAEQVAAAEKCMRANLTLAWSNAPIRAKTCNQFHRNKDSRR